MDARHGHLHLIVSEHRVGVLLLPAGFELAAVLTWRDKDTFARATGDAHPLPAAGCNSARWLPTWLPAG
jgi:hypothetical protein